MGSKMEPIILQPENIVLQTETTILHNDTCSDYGSTRSLSKKPLRRNVTYIQAVSMIVTCMIGSGVYISPSLVAARSQNMFIAIIVWILAGGCALLGSLCYNELASLVKKTGSSYIFVFECYGNYPAFLLLWINAVILIPCCTSITAYTAGMYICRVFDDNESSETFVWYSKLFAVILFSIAVAINCIGMKTTGSFQTFFTLIHVGMVLLIVGFAIYHASKTKTAINLKPSIMFNNTLSGVIEHIPDLGSAMFNALWCFDGWYMVAHFVEEIVEPKKNIPLVAFTGVPTVTFVYVLINIACLTVLSQQEMAGSTVVVTTLAERVGGRKWIYVIPFFVSMGCLGALVGDCYNLSRFLMSASREGQFPAVFGVIHKNKRTPIPALLYIGFVSSLMIVCYGENLEIIMRYVNLGLWIEYGLAISTLIVFRYTRPHIERTYKVWITTPLFMICVAVTLIVASFITDPQNTSILLAVTVTGIPVYYMCIKKSWFSFLQFDVIKEKLMKNTGLVECEVDNSFT